MISGREVVERLTRVEEGQKRLEEGQKQLGEHLARLEEGQKQLGERLVRVEEGQRGLDKRIDGLDKRIDDLGRQIDRLVIIVIGGIGITFAGMFALVGFVIWDRRSALAPAVRRIEELQEREERVEAVLREYAVKSPELAESLKKVGLL